jgi:hypothetical protein
MAPVFAIRRNDAIEAFAKRLQQADKPPEVVIVACRRKSPTLISPQTCIWAKNRYNLRVFPVGERMARDFFRGWALRPFFIFWLLESHESGERCTRPAGNDAGGSGL